MQFLALGFAIIFFAICAMYSWPIALLLLFACIAIVCSNNDKIRSSLADFFEPADSRFEILSESDDEIILRGNQRVMILNRTRRTVRGLHGKLADFDQIKHIQISGDDEDQYTVSLDLGDWFSTISLGSTDSQVDASIMAAKLSTWTGKKVIA